MAHSQNQYSSRSVCVPRRLPEAPWHSQRRGFPETRALPRRDCETVSRTSPPGPCPSGVRCRPQSRAARFGQGQTGLFYTPHGSPMRRHPVCCGVTFCVGYVGGRCKNETNVNNRLDVEVGGLWATGTNAVIGKGKNRLNCVARAKWCVRPKNPAHPTAAVHYLLAL